MAWSEVHRLTLILITDPSSQVCSAIRGWVHPIDRQDIVLRDIFDLQHASKTTKRPKPYGRPWDKNTPRVGAGTSVTIAEYEAIKRAAAEN